MKLLVNPHKIKILEEEFVNEKEIDISRVQFEFADEITDDYVKEALFTFKGNTYKKIIFNNECEFAQEALAEKGMVEIGVVAYKVEDEQTIKRYNPSPVYFDTLYGSLKEATNSEPITPSEMEQYEQQLNEGLDAIDEAIDQAENLDIDITTEGDNTVVVITRKDGTTKEATVSGGAGTITDVEVDGTSVVTDGVANIDLTGKQDTLVSGTNIKTINGQDITGSGNITIESGTGDVADVYYDDESVLDSDKIAQLYSEIYVGDTAPTKSQKIWIDTTEDDVALKDLQDDTTHRLVTDTEKTTWSGKQDALVSGTNIKTINNQSLLGSGNITIQGGGGGTATDVQINGTSIVNNDVANIITNTAYNASSNKIATMSDVPTVPTNISSFTNDSGYITGISSSDVTTALGYTPYNSTNPDGYTTEQIQYDIMPTASVDNVGKIIQYVGATDYQYQQGFFYYCEEYQGDFGDTLYGWTNLQLFDPTLIDHPLKFINYNAFFMYNTIASTFDSNSSTYGDIYVCNYNGKKYIASKLITGSPNTIIFTSLGATTNDIVTLDSNNTWSNSTKELQEQLVSGTNIKTINNQSILGSGNITISGGGTATDVQVNGVSIVSNDVANIITETAYNASTNKIATMSDVPNITGKEDKTTITTSASTTVTQEIANNNEYRYTGNVSSLTITLPSSIDNDYISWVVFNSGSTATSIVYPNTIKWSGDDVSSNTFVPVASKTYNICFWYDGINVNAVVRGV